jgi:hypothetical protein
MIELLSGLENVVPYAKLAAMVIAATLILIAAAALTYTVQVVCRPLCTVMQWMVAYTPGEKPGEVIQGISMGARMLVWAALIGLVVWIVFH